jgi:beta-galactosidase
MTKLTRRSLLKTGLAASAGFAASDHLLRASVSEKSGEEFRDQPLMSRRNQEPHEPISLHEKLSLDSGWRFHLGNAADPSRDFSFGAPAIEGTFAKSGQIVGHNFVRNGHVVQLARNDNNWRIVDVPHDWAVELPFVEAKGPNVSAHAAHGGKPLGREYPETSIGWYRRRFDVPVEDKGLRLSLEFDGVFRDSMIVFNGLYLGKNLRGIPHLVLISQTMSITAVKTS